MAIALFNGLAGARRSFRDILLVLTTTHGQYIGVGLWEGMAVLQIMAVL